ncbi:MAG TPA: hypothetical protein VF708_05445, partial [Pyrinomonadaceae bacterium]
ADEFTSISNIVGAGLVPARFCSTGGQGQALPLLSSLTSLIHTKTALASAASKLDAVFGDLSHRSVTTPKALPTAMFVTD